MNVPVPPVNTIEWPNRQYEYLRTFDDSTNSKLHTEHLNKYSEKGWELIHIHQMDSNRAFYYWRKLKVLGVPI